MPRHEPSSRDTSEVAPGGKVVMKRDKDGNIIPVLPPLRIKETIEAEERPQQADDPRPSSWRNVPPHGAGGF